MTNIRLLAVAVATFSLCGCITTAPVSVSKLPASAAMINDPNCLSETGSRLSSKPNCRGFGRSYNYDDISRTGATTAGDALSLLDPAITVHR